MSLKEKLESIIEEDDIYTALYSHDDVRLLEDEIIDTGRWSVFKRAVVGFGDKFFAIEYDEGATEYQDSSGEFTVYEVNPVVKQVVAYVRVKS